MSCIRAMLLVCGGGLPAQQTHSAAVGVFLVQTDGTSSTTVANRVRAAVGVGPQVNDIATSRRIVGSNLTAVSLSGLTKVELAFALVLAAASTGLVLALGFGERRRSFAIAAALGAKTRQLGAFAWSEAGFVTAGGILLGAVAATGLSIMLVNILTGVFDPPPDTLAIPWGYLVAVTVVAIAAVGAATAAVIRRLREPHMETLRDL